MKHDGLHNLFALNERELRRELCEVGTFLALKNLVGATEGNISCRLSDSLLLASPSGIHKGHLKPDQLVVVDLDGNVVASTNGQRLGFRDASPTESSYKPSSELKMHLEIYRQRPDCQAIVHAHPLIATGFALADETLPDDVMPEAAEVLGPVALVPFGMPGTDELPIAMRPYCQDHKTFLLAGHGATVMGKDLWDAAYRMETLERIATMVLVANLLGGAKRMPTDAFQVVLSKSLSGRL